jgi:glutamate 5-kinase
MAGVLVVAKLGTSSLTDDGGRIDDAAVAKVAGEVAGLRAAGHQIVLVSSGAIAAGLPALGLSRPSDMPTLQALAAVGQHRLMATWDRLLGVHGLVPGQVLLAPYDFVARTQYLHARQTLNRLLALGVVPIVNENDAVADDEIRFGDNDRIAALVAHLVGADLLVLLTDTPGLLTADPRTDGSATLIEEIVQVDEALEALAGGTGTERGSGGMASKLAAAKMAAWSGVPAVIAAASRRDVLTDAVDGKPNVGTVFRPREKRLAARKLWIAFAIASSGTVIVDDGARRALVQRNVSLLPAGVVATKGRFDEGDAVEVADSSGAVFAKGLVRHASSVIDARVGLRTNDLPDEGAHEVIHRDDLVVLP